MRDEPPEPIPLTAPPAWYGPVADDVSYAMEISAVGGTAVLAIRGEVDLRTAPRLWSDLERAISDGAVEVVLDLQRLEFIDSSGLSVLVKALKLLRERQGDLLLRSVTPRTYRVLDVAGLTKVLSVETA